MFYKTDCHRASSLSGPFPKKKCFTGVSEGLCMCPAAGTKISVSDRRLYFPQVLWDLGALNTEKTMDFWEEKLL